MLPITVNRVTTQVEVPLSGRSSELFGVAGGWEDSAVFGILVEGWEVGSNEVVIGKGLKGHGADFVGINVRWQLLEDELEKENWNKDAVR